MVLRCARLARERVLLCRFIRYMYMKTSWLCNFFSRHFSSQSSYTLAWVPEGFVFVLSDCWQFAAKTRLQGAKCQEKTVSETLTNREHGLLHPRYFEADLWRHGTYTNLWNASRAPHCQKKWHSPWRYDEKVHVHVDSCQNKFKHS